MRRVFKLIAAFLVFIPLVSTAWQDPLPPLNKKTIVGVWEAIPEDARLLYHMEINAKGDSYLALNFHPKSPYHGVFKLLSSKIQDGNIKLHFHSITEKDALTDLWIDGKGVGHGGDSGVIDGIISSDNGKTDRQKIKFMKGTWTRNLAEQSKMAEKSIANKTTYP